MCACACLIANRYTNCVAPQAGSLHSRSASSTAAAENPPLLKRLSECRETRSHSGEGKWAKVDKCVWILVCLNLQLICKHINEEVNYLRGCFFRDFLNSLRLYRTYYGGLADQLCVSELASGDGLSCWNGTDTVKRFVLNRSKFRLVTQI